MSSMRYFNTHGPVNENEHYVVSRKELVTDLVAQISQGKYFTIFAPRQMGKTTLLRSLRDLLQEQPEFIPVTLSFQRFEDWAVDEFMAEFGRLLARRIMTGVRNKFPTEVDAVMAVAASHPPQSFAGFWIFFDELHEQIPDAKVVLIVDEFDGTPTEALSPLLQTWRDMYLDSEPPRSLHSVVLIGIQNVATLNLGRSSPFNIANQLALPNFTRKQVHELLRQYTDETGQSFGPGVIDEIYRLATGNPFLVNRLAAILTEDIATDRLQPIDDAALNAARQKLIVETNYNFETIKRHASHHQEAVLNILFGAS